MENRVWNSFAVYALVAFVLSNSAVVTNSVNSNTGVSSIKTVGPPAVNNTTSTLIIDIYYEGMCGDSMVFMEKQFNPTYKKLNTYLTVTFIPFSLGKITPAENITDTKFECKRIGECDADIVHTCAIKHIKMQDDLVKFVTCALTEGIKSETKKIPVDKCSKSSNIDDATIVLINECVSNITEYTPLLAADVKSAANEKVEYVPRIVFNKKYSPEIQELAKTQFLKAVCNAIHFNSELPEVCKNIDSGSNTFAVGMLSMFIGLYHFIKLF